jgi:hypothetical protein
LNSRRLGSEPENGRPNCEGEGKNSGFHERNLQVF